MEFSVAYEHQELIRMVRRFIDAELKPLEDEVEESGILKEQDAKRIFEKSSALGLYAMNVPEELGGAGLSAVETMLVEEQFGHTSDILVRRAFGNVYEVLFACDQVQRQRWLLPTVRGIRTCSIAITEPGAGSDAAAIATRAELKGDGWTLTGGKHFISDGAYSDYFVVSAVTDKSKGNKGISLFLVDKDSPGLSLGRDQKMMGLRGTSHVELFFDQVRLERVNLLGELGTGMRQILTTLGRVRLGQVGARSIGKASHVLNLAVEYANGRKQFGQPIGEFQMIQQMIADSVIEINSARLLLLRAAWEIDRGKDARDWISMVKVHATEVANKVADRAVQIFGGMGYCKDLPIERYYRDLRIGRIYDGTSEIHRLVIARSTLNSGSKLFDGLWSGAWTG
jgi:acyl-CoA dehydrogenase